MAMAWSTMHLTLVLLCLVVSHAHGSSRVVRWSDHSDVTPPSTTAAAAPAPSATAAPATSTSADTPASGLSLPVTQNVVADYPGLFKYTVLAGYGTPAQQLPMYFDVSGGSSRLRCKPCFSSQGSSCDVGFDPSKSSSLRTVPCGSPDCDFSCSTGGSCSITFKKNSTFVSGNGTVVMDTLTLSPSATFENFVALCLHLDNDLFTNEVAIGRIDLSPSRQSLATRVLNSSPPAGTAAFSYCLPADTDTHGFLTIAPALSDYSALAGVKYVPLVSNPNGPSAYYVDLVSIAINGKDLLLPPALFRDKGTVIDSREAFTYLNRPIYVALRDEFKKAMAQYPPAPAFRELDTCYNFTLTEIINLPDITFRFGNGETMDLNGLQFMYFFEHLTDEFGCLAFAATPFRNYIGTLVQQTKEIVYDIRGGKVAFVPNRCGLR